MKSVLCALSLLLLAQRSVQEDSPAQRACKALQEKYPKVTTYSLEPVYENANTGMRSSVHRSD